MCIEISFSHTHIDLNGALIAEEHCERLPWHAILQYMASNSIYLGISWYYSSSFQLTGDHQIDSSKLDRTYTLDT